MSATVKRKESDGGCGGCPVYAGDRLHRLGIHTEGWDHVVALAGNPNTGKSTLFNALTGLRQHTGNWPGKTVTRAEGGYSYDSSRFKLIDLPGTYSLLSNSPDEEIARNFLLFGRPDVTIVVVDATRLESNLNLVLQVLEITPSAVIALNLIDEAGRHGISVDDRKLSRELGVPVVPVSARSRDGLPALLSRVTQVARGGWTNTHVRQYTSLPRELDLAVQELSQTVSSIMPAIPNPRWIAMRLLEGDPTVIHAIQEGTLGIDAPGQSLQLERAASGALSVSGA